MGWPLCHNSWAFQSAASYLATSLQLIRVPHGFMTEGWELSDWATWINCHSNFLQWFLVLVHYCDPMCMKGQLLTLSVNVWKRRIPQFKNHRQYVFCHSLEANKSITFPLIFCHKMWGRPLFISAATSWTIAQNLVRRTRWKGGTVTRSGRRGSGREWNDVANGLEMCELYGGGDSEKLRSKQRNVNYKVN